MPESPIVEELARALLPPLLEAVRDAVSEALAEARPAPAPAPLLSLKEAARRCSCSVATIRRAIKTDRLKTVTALGRRPLVKSEDLELFISGGVR